MMKRELIHPSSPTTECIPITATFNNFYANRLLYCRIDLWRNSKRRRLHERGAKSANNSRFSGAFLFSAGAITVYTLFSSRIAIKYHSVYGSFDVGVTMVSIV